jgi:sugar lactone lactonase YvrE
MDMQNLRSNLAVVSPFVFLLLVSHLQAQSIFVGDSTNDTLWKFSVGGSRTTLDSGYAPYGLAFDNSDDLYAADLNGGNIYKYAPDGSRTVFANGLNSPDGMAFDSSGNLFVTSLRGNLIYEIAPGGSMSTFATTGLNSPVDIAFDSSGNLFESDAHNILEFTRTGGQLSTIPTVFASAVIPQGLAFDTAGNLFEADDESQVIYEYPAGSPPNSEPGSFAPILEPAGLAFDSSGDLFGLTGGSVYEFNRNPSTGQHSGTTVFASGLGQLTDVAISPVPEPSAAIELLFSGAAFLSLRRWGSARSREWRIFSQRLF